MTASVAQLMTYPYDKGNRLVGTEKPLSEADKEDGETVGYEYDGYD